MEMTTFVLVEVIGLIWLVAFEMREAAVRPMEAIGPVRKADLEKDLLKRKILFVVSMVLLGVVLYSAFLLWGEVNHTHFGCLPLILFAGAVYAIDLNAKTRRVCDNKEYVREIGFMTNFSTWLCRACIVLAVIALIGTILGSRPAYKYLEQGTTDVVCEGIVVDLSDARTEGYYLAEDLSAFYSNSYYKEWASCGKQEMHDVDVYLIDCASVKPHIVWQHEVKQKLLPDDYGRYTVVDGAPQSYNSYILYIDKDMFDSLVLKGKINPGRGGWSLISSIYDLSEDKEFVTATSDPYEYIGKLRELRERGSRVSGYSPISVRGSTLSNEPLAGEFAEPA